MREINQTEIAAVSGAGLTEFLGEVNTALTEVSGLFDTTVASIKESNDLGQTLGLTYKAIGLNFAKSFLNAFSGFLTKLAA
ncbi:MAG TPA: hypothetical protein DEF80_11405 [Pantoea sp.]|nr:hypothetical protein [Pantoea sp.]